MIKNYSELKVIKDNVSLVEDLKGTKLILKQYPKNENKYTSIYLHEIEALKKIQHDNVVKIKESKEDNENYYLFFEYVEGENFVDKFLDLDNEKKKCAFFKSTIKLLETIGYIHSRDFMHKDIKPSNIIIDLHNNPYILDFGTSIISNTITKTIQDLSLWYASPEQKNNQEIDITTDLYSFGITLLEALVDKNDFEAFTKSNISIDELINNIKKFDDGINEEIKNIIKKLSHEEKKYRYQTAKEVIIDIKVLLEFINCDNRYELNISDVVKKKFEEDFKKKPWDILEFIENKLKKEIKYIEYGKDKYDRDQIKLATTDFILYCGIKSEQHFYVVGYSQRVPDSVKQNGHIIDDEFILTDGNPKGLCNNTSYLIDKLVQLNKEKIKKEKINEEKRSFLDKTVNQLKIERAILDEKKITLFAQKVPNGHKKGKKEVVVKIIDMSNKLITEKHLRYSQREDEEKFIHELFKDGFIGNPNSSELLKLLNLLIKECFFEKNKKDIAKKLLETLGEKRRKTTNVKTIEDMLTKDYKNKKSKFEKWSFNADRLFHMYKNYLIKQKEEDKFFGMNDDVIVESINQNIKFNKKFVVTNIDITNKQIRLKYSKEISKIPDELKISFDYKRSTAVLNKQKFSVEDLKNNNTTIENLLSKISNPNTLSPKREIPKCENYANKNIDENQQEAVDKALSLEIGEYLVIQGPPGTGKTTVITEIISQILSTNKLAKILVTSQSNQAVDNVLEKTCEIEDKIVRFGNNKSKLSKIANKYHEEAVFDKYLQDVKNRLEEDKENYFIQSQCLNELHKKWRKQILSGDDELKTLLFKKIRVIFGTLVGISSWEDFRAVEFDYIIVDEAGRATLAELMIPIKKGKRFILVGDHKQLPPIVDDEVLSKMEKYNKKDLEITLFEELYKKIEHNDFKHFLKFNYRSDVSIAKIYSDVFYDGEIETKDSLKREHKLNFDKKVYFYSTSKLDKRFDEQSGTGKINNTNRDEIIKILIDIEKQASENNIKKSVGVITPYLAQRDNIKSKFGNIQNEFNMLSIDINSVDAFQGSDRDIIIYDIVRSQENNKANIEFIADEKRLNVALSRTKELLFIMGDADFIYNTSVKDKNNPFKDIIGIINKDKDNYQIKELKNE